LPRLDVLIETIGGESDPPYLIGQMLHDYADKISFLVPNKALSAGTEICLAGHQVIMGEDATLSPIDTQFRDDEGRWWSETAIEHFRELADGAEGEDTRTAIIASTIGSIAPETIAKAYRESRVAAQHAEQLLNQHMLKDASPDQIKEVLDRLTKTAPSHECVNFRGDQAGIFTDISPLWKCGSLRHIRLLCAGQSPPWLLSRARWRYQQS